MKFSVGMSAAATGILAASMTMSSEKKSGRTTNRPGHSKRSFSAPGPGWISTVTSPFWIRRRAETSTPSALRPPISAVAAPLPCSTSETRSSEPTPGSASFARTTPPLRSSAAAPFRATATWIRPLDRTASPLKAVGSWPSAIGSFSEAPRSKTEIPVFGFSCVKVNSSAASVRSFMGSPVIPDPARTGTTLARAQSPQLFV